MFITPTYIKSFKDYSEKIKEVQEILPDMLPNPKLKNPLTRVLTVCGDPGCGKSYSINKFIDGLKNKYDQFKNVGDISSIMLHQALYKHYNGLIYLDECDTIFRGSKNMLKAAADSNTDRLVSYSKMVKGTLVDCSSVGTDPVACEKYISDKAYSTYSEPKQHEKLIQALENWTPQNFIFRGSIILVSNLSKQKINEYIGSDALATRGRMIEFKIANYDAWIDIITHNCKNITEYAGNKLDKSSVKKALKWIESDKLKSLFTENNASISMRYFGECATQYNNGKDDNYMVRHFQNMVQKSVR